MMIKFINCHMLEEWFRLHCFMLLKLCTESSSLLLIYLVVDIHCPEI